MMGRRFFAALVGSAPVAVPAMAQVKQGSSIAFSPDLMLNEMSERAPPPSPLELLQRRKQRKFHAFRESLDRSNHRWHNMNYGHSINSSIPVSIEVLKSVTTQHKLRMLQRLNEEQRKKRNNALSQFSKLLGFEEEYKAWSKNNTPMF